MVTVAVITPDGTPSRLDVDPNGVAGPQAVVGGYIELVQSRFEPELAAFVNEDGRRLHLAPNPVASRLLGVAVVGPAMFFGFVLGDPEIRDCPADLLAALGV